MKTRVISCLERVTRTVNIAPPTVSNEFAAGFFGVQNIINDFINGWILMTEQPVRIGDFIEIDQFVGTVGGERELRQVRSNIRYMISELFAAENIVIAYPQRDVHIDSLGPLQVELPGKSDTDEPAPKSL